MKRLVVFLGALAVAGGLFFSPAARSHDEPFTFPSNSGVTGLMNVPTARVMQEKRWRTGISYVRPYWYYYGTVSPFKRFEVNGRFTKVEGLPALSPDYGDFKDKAVDLKYQIIPEGKYRPAVALGFMDPHGTRVFSSQYVVASKQIYPFDFTIGFGDGWFGKRRLPEKSDGFDFDLFSHPDRWRSEGRFFYGVQFAPSERFALMAEYSPTDYSIQAGSNTYFKENPASSKFNVGLRWKPFSWSTIDLSWQRGDEPGIGVSFEFELGRPFIPIYDHLYRELPEHADDAPELRMARALNESGFSDIGATFRGDMLIVDLQNDSYFFTPRALGVAVEVLAPLVPDHVDRVDIIVKENGIPAVRLITTREDMVLYETEQITAKQFLYLSEFDTANRYVPAGEKHDRTVVDLGIKPIVQFFINDPSGFFKYRVGIGAAAEIRPRPGSSFIAGISTYPVNTISTSNIAPSQAVRSDIVPYIEESVVLDRLMAQHIVKGPAELYLKAAAGILEAQYAGIDVEAGLPVFGGRLMVGGSGSVVKKREPGSFFSMHDNPSKDYYSTAFFDTRLNLPELDAWIDVKAGRFLAGDRGARVTVSKFYNGLTLFAWYGMTGTSMFDDPYNRGYRDKGVGVSIPLRFFKGSDSRTTYSMAISPWSRDVAQDITRHTTLFDYMGRNIKIFLDKDSSFF